MGDRRGRLKVAILGGGMGGLATALRLLDEEGGQDHYDITIYQSGHLLGGKCASARDAAKDHRIEEHGLHVLLGFYDHVFYVMRRAYEALRRAGALPAEDPGAAWWAGILEPKDSVVLMEKRERGWLPREIHFP